MFVSVFVCLFVCLNKVINESLVFRQVEKRHVFAHMAHTVCPAQTELRQLFKARDINDTVVEVFQPLANPAQQQWFYTVTCTNWMLNSMRDCRNCCIGIDHVRRVVTLRTCDRSSSQRIIASVHPKSTLYFGA